MIEKLSQRIVKNLRGVTASYCIFFFISLLLKAYRTSSIAVLAQKGRALPQAFAYTSIWLAWWCLQNLTIVAGRCQGKFGVDVLSKWNLEKPCPHPLGITGQVGSTQRAAARLVSVTRRGATRNAAQRGPRGGRAASANSIPAGWLSPITPHPPQCLGTACTGGRGEAYRTTKYQCHTLLMKCILVI